MSIKYPTSAPKEICPGKVAVYTCITQNYDSLKTPLSIDTRFAYFCFTDTPACVMPPWEYSPFCMEELSPKDQNRYIKMHPHEFLSDYDITVYIDGNIQIVGELYPLIYLALNSPEDIFIYKHPLRACIYEEAAACATYSHDWIWNIATQMRRYRKDRYPVDNGLFEANVIIRKHSESMRRLMDQWWTEYRAGAKRDQLSLPYAAWRLGIPLGCLGESDPRFDHKYFAMTHRPARWSLMLTLRKYINRLIASLVSYRRLFGLPTE